MIKINENYLKLQGSYLFSEIAHRVDAYKTAHPTADIIRLGIGDVTRPLTPTVIRAMHRAVDEMADASSFRGYGPEQGYEFLRQAIVDHDFASRGVTLDADEIFVSDGAKCDTGNFQELFSGDVTVAVTDPVYPVYVDTNVMAGRTGAFDPTLGQYEKMVYLPTNAANSFCPALPKEKVDVVYLCSPNNPTGTAMTYEQLKTWVDYAIKNQVLLLFDAAYERFITQSDIPHSIYEIPGAKQCAVEFRSFSKTAGFTGTRCAYTVVPKELMGTDRNGNRHSLHALWNRRHTTKFNGVSYIVQRGAEAIYSEEGKKEVDATISLYLNNAKIILEGLSQIGITAYGGQNSPYVWLKTPGDLNSWDFFDKLLFEANIVGTPGAGFGAQGEGYFRLTAFNTEENTRRAVERLAQLKL